MIVPFSRDDKRRSVIGALAMALAVGVAACQLGAAPDTSSPSGSAPPSTASAGACPNIDLRSPSGERIALTGTWQTEREGTRAGIYFLHQVGECVWFAGGYPRPPETHPDGPLGFVTVVFRGRVGSDFLITGEWMDVRLEGPGPLGSGGSITLRIEFGDQPSDMRLVYAGGTGQSFVEPGYREEQSWAKISDGGAYPPSSAAP